MTIALAYQHGYWLETRKENNKRRKKGMKKLCEASYMQTKEGRKEWEIMRERT